MRTIGAASRKRIWLTAAAVALLTTACSDAGPTSRPGISPVATPPSSAPSSDATAVVTTAGTTAGAIERGGLLFSWYGGVNGKIAFVVSRDGSNLRQIMSDVVGDIRALSWRPDGDLMTFVVRDNLHPDGAIWSAAPDGTGAALLYDGLSDGCTSVFYPVWSPDGSKLSIVCFVDRDTTHTADLAVLEVATLKLTKLVTYRWPDALDNPARWSHDGSRIAYDVLHWDPTNTFLEGSRIATIDATGSAKPSDLNKLDSFAASPAWSPDDSFLLYNTYDFGNMTEATVSDLYSVRPDGSGVQQFLTAAQAGVSRIGHPAWDPTGTRIWVGVRVGSDTFHIGWIDPDTRALTILPTIAAGAEPRP